jgi:cytoskeletal protein CcmA (bactofilin family)
MFEKNQKEFDVKEAETIIGPSVKVKGNFTGQGNIIIEGEVEGNIKTNKFLLVGNRAVITASIDASEAKIGGTINGNITIKGYLEITASARINGDINAAEISVERGAMINGKCNMSGEKNKKEIEETK